VIDDASVYLAETERAMQAQAADGIDAVPHVVFEGRRRDIALTGAKEVEEYGRVLEQIYKESL
jgi:predicted DsbA family dithiol-disulfide isomerase